MPSFYIQDHTLGQMLDETVRRFPDRDAVIYVGSGKKQSWREFSETVEKLGRGLLALGIKPGEKIALWATNVPYWVAMLFAAARIGAVLLAVNTNYRDHELKYLISQSECENFVCLDSFLDYDYIAALDRLIPDLSEQPEGNVRSAAFPKLRRVICIRETTHPGIISLSKLFELSEKISQSEYAEACSHVVPADVVNMQYTSGTTGAPKGVMLTHSGIVRNGYSIGEREELSENDRVVIPVPLFHCFGIVLGVMACVSHGSAMIILESFSPEKVMSSIQTEKATVLYGVPSNFTAILGHRRFMQYDYGSLRAILMSGSVCPEPLIRQVLRMMNIDAVFIPYGLTEASPVITMTAAGDTDEHRFFTVGRALDNIEVQILDVSTGLPVAPGNPGEVCCRGYNVMRGYYNMPEATAEVISADGWLKTGDLGVLDDEGYLKITGRIKDMIVRGGENIYPREIEEELLLMPGVSDVQVVGVPSKRYGEDVVAFIIAAQGYTIGAEDIREFCRGRVAWHKVPKYVVCIDEFPKTANGKIQKNKLRERAVELFPDAK